MTKMPGLLLLICGICAAVVAGSGCTALQMQKESEQREVRIAAKEQELKGLQREDAALNAEKEKLLAELQSQKVDVEKLNAQLEAVRWKNRETKASTEALVKKKTAFDAQLKSYQKELKATQGNTDLSVEKKRKRIEELREQIRTYLKMNLNP